MRRTTALIGMLWVAVTAWASTDPLTFVGVNRDMAMLGTKDMAMSADQLHVYVVAGIDDAITVFGRDATTGELSWLSTLRSPDFPDSSVLGSPKSLAVSPDGANVYVGTAYGLTVFQRAPATGDLTFLEVHLDGEGGVTTIEDLEGVALSPDGKHVLVASITDDSLSVYSRNLTTGALTFVGAHTDGAVGVDGLDGARAIAMSPDGGSVYVAGSVDDAVALFDRDAMTGALTFINAVKDTDGGVDGLDGARDVDVSADGVNVYVAGYGEDSIAIFDRYAIPGSLAFVGLVADGDPGIGNLSHPRALAVSPDGGHLYAAAGTEVAIFARSSGEGGLSPLGTVPKDDTGNPVTVVVSGDGMTVVVAADRQVSTLDRTPSTGALALIDSELSATGLDGAVGITADVSPCIQVASYNEGDDQVLVSQGSTEAPLAEYRFNYGGGRSRAVVASSAAPVTYWAVYDTDTIVMRLEDSPNPCTSSTFSTASYVNGSGGIVDLEGPQHMALSPDQAHLYVAALVGDAVVSFSRNPSTSELTLVGAEVDGAGGVDGLDGAFWVEVSPDGAHVYVAGYYDDAVAGFSRDASTGRLTFMWAVRDGDGGIVDGLNGASSVVISPDGAHAYVAGRVEHSIAIFARDTHSGAFTYLGKVVDGAGGIDGLGGARAIAVSPDGDQIYVASQNDNALAVFSRDATTGLLVQVGLHLDGIAGVDGLDAANGIAVSPDAMQVHVTGYDDDAVATFVRTGEIFSDGFETGDVSRWSSSAGVIP